MNENIRIIVLATFAAAGRTGWAHLEDIALQADKLAPGRYRWEKHKNMVSDRIVSSWLSDASKEKYGSLIKSRRKQARSDERKIPKGQENDWALTEAGVHVIEKEQILNRQPLKDGQRSAEKQTIQKEKIRLIEELAYKKFSRGQIEEISNTEIHNFFRINEYIQGEARKSRLERIKIMFLEDETLREAINYFINRLEGGR